MSKEFEGKGMVALDSVTTESEVSAVGHVSYVPGLHRARKKRAPQRRAAPSRTVIQRRRAMSSIKM